MELDAGNAVSLDRGDDPSFVIRNRDDDRIVLGLDRIAVREVDVLPVEARDDRGAVGEP